MKLLIQYRVIIFTIFAIIFYSCSASEKKDNDDQRLQNYQNKDNYGEIIIKTALEEQNQPFYSPIVDTTYLYWLNNRIAILKNSSKCNIFLLNVLYKAGCKTPSINLLAKDLFEDSLYNDLFPIVDIADYKDIKRGDFLITQKHVIIFDSLTVKNGTFYAKAIWAGTKQHDNGDNIKNNVIYGLYPLDERFKVRRPIPINF